VQGNDALLPPSVAEALCRVTQEALHNVARHARATRADVNLRCLPEQVMLTVRDNGVGFDTGQARRGLGLANMQERVMSVGGRLAVESQPGAGTGPGIDDWKKAVVRLAMTNLRQEFGDLTLDESLVARERIAQNLQTALNKFAEEWGLVVSKVEIMLIDPPDDIKKAMRKQKTAEQERRSMRLLATGEYEDAEQQKLAMIQRIEGVCRPRATFARSALIPRWWC
jgi:regulator of protease activity HflC (stomatin/prohibitin superfamily)